MKSILCYGDSNTWGYVPGSLDFTTWYMERYSRNDSYKTAVDTGLIQVSIKGRDGKLLPFIGWKFIQNKLGLLVIFCLCKFKLKLIHFNSLRIYLKKKLAIDNIFLTTIDHIVHN